MTPRTGPVHAARARVAALLLRAAARIDPCWMPTDLPPLLPAGRCWVCGAETETGDEHESYES